MLDYYGYYRTSRPLGCRQDLLTEAQSLPAFVGAEEEPQGPEFPDQISYLCPACDKDHPFRLYNVYQASNPSMKKRFLSWALQQGVETDVILP